MKRKISIQQILLAVLITSSMICVPINAESIEPSVIEDIQEQENEEVSVEVPVKTEDTEETPEVSEEPGALEENTEEASTEENVNTETTEELVNTEESSESEEPDTEEVSEETPEEVSTEVIGEFYIYYNGCDLKDETIYVAGDVVELPEVDSKTFLGWALKDKAEKEEYHAGDVLTFTDKDIVLYAVFKEEPKGIFKLSRDSSTIFSFTGSADISIDGNFSDWDGLPYSYEYNWDNSENCWYYGVWIPTDEGNVCCKTPEGEYSTDVRHKMQLYCDGKYVYLHVIISRDYGSRFNGEDYQFTIDGNMAAFQVEWPGGGTITGNLNNMVSPGTYAVEVKHRDASMSYDKAEGSSGYLKVDDDYVNNELEIAIPLSELVRQNGSINLDTMSTIEFYTPNLMYKRISAAGTPIGSLFLALLVIFIVFNGLLFLFVKGNAEGVVEDEEL